jgi:thiamine biosynthesis lipoprotein
MTKPTFARDTRLVMGGEATITVVGGNPAMMDDAFAVAERCESVWSRFRSDSELSRINALAPAAVEVSPLTIALVAEMIEGFALTDGDFNPTVLPSVLAVGYERSEPEPNLRTERDERKRSLTSLEGIHISETSVSIPREMSLDAGGIGKGFAADLIAGALMLSGAAGTMVSFSGDIVVAGEAPDARAWRIGIENPFTPGEHVAIVDLSEGAVVTSSQRKKTFAGGHHLIDPRTGASAQSRVQTATIIAMSGARAEVLAKSAFLREPDELLEWLPTVGAAGLLILDDAQEMFSANWRDYVVS